MTFSLEVAQSTPICILLSAVGGAIEVFATAILAYKDAVERESGKSWSRAASICALAANVFLQVSSSVIGNLFAPWFGPVSLVGPIFLCAQLVANMIVFGSILGLESFNKDMKVGTYVVVIGVILLPIVGPGVQEDQDVANLLDQWYSYLWSALMVAGMLISAALLLVLNVPALGSVTKMSILLVARATAFTLNLTVSKVMVLDVSLMVLVTSIVLKIASGLVITYALIVQASAVPQATFAPLNASALILVNAITGMVIWEDWLVVGSWVGYVCVFVQLIIGNYLLLGDIVLLSPDNTKYGRVKAIHMVGSIAGSKMYCGDLRTVDGDTTIDSGETELATVQTVPYEVGEGGAYEYWENDGGIEATPQRPRRRVSAREAWSSVYGIDPNNAAGGTASRRRRTIFTIDEEDSKAFEEMTEDDINRRGSF